MPFPIDRAFFGLVEELRANQPALQRPEEQHARPDDQWKCRENVCPERGIERHLQPNRERESGNGRDSDGKERRSVRRIGKRVIQAADLAALVHRKEAVEQLALLAAGTPPFNAGKHRASGGRVIIVHRDHLSRNCRACCSRSMRHLVVHTSISESAFHFK